MVYLKAIGIGHFEVDAVNFDPRAVTPSGRPDASAALKRAPAAAAHDRWFREQAAPGIKAADDPSTQWVAHETVKAERAKRRTARRRRAAAHGPGRGGA